MFPDAMKFGARLKAAIDASPHTREQVADAAGVTATTVQRWQTGGPEPGAFALARAAKFLGTTGDALLGVDGSPAQEEIPPPKQAVRAGLEILRLPNLKRRAVMQLVSLLLADTETKEERGSAPLGDTSRSLKTKKAREG